MRSPPPDSRSSDRIAGDEAHGERPFRPLSIALVFSGLELSGSVRCCLALAEALHKRGHRVAVFSPGGPLARTLERMAIPASVWERGNLSPGYVAMLGLAKAMQAFAPDVVHSATLSALPLSRRLLSRHAAPIVANVESIAAIGQTSGYLELCRHLITAGHETREALVNHAGIDRRRISVIRPGVPADAAIDCAARDRERSRFIKGVACIGPLINREGLLRLVAAGKRIAERNLPMRLVLIGDGPCAADVRKAIRQQELGREVLLMSELYDSEGMYEVADAVVTVDDATDCAWFGLEAMGRGIPVLAAGYGANLEWVENEVTGLVYAPTGDEELGEMLERIALNPGLRARVADAAWQAVRSRHSIAAMVEETEAVYLEQVLSAQAL